MYMSNPLQCVLTKTLLKHFQFQYIVSGLKKFFHHSFPSMYHTEHKLK